MTNDKQFKEDGSAVLDTRPPFADGPPKQKPEQRVFLLLQGPQSPFFRRLGDALQRAGAQVIKVNFCGGDVLLWARRGALSYRGTENDWPLWVSRLMRERGVTDLLAFGLWRPRHWEAALLARQMGIRVFSLEEGYLRPNYITLEEGGNNGRSLLPHQPEDVSAMAAAAPDPPPPQQADNPLLTRFLYAMGNYHFGNVLFFPKFFHYHTHRPYCVVRELKGWFVRALKLLLGGERRYQRRWKRFDESQTPYFLFPLQLDADSQVRLYSPFSGMREAIGEVIASFARWADPELHLIVKNHPLDNGLIDYRNFVRNFARACGVEKRVHFLDIGLLDPFIRKIARFCGVERYIHFTEHNEAAAMTEKSRGLVVLNSTIGLAALQQGKPVYCVGRSIYAMPGLAQSEPFCQLKHFWANPAAPDLKLLEDFVKVVKTRALANGNFYSREGIAQAVHHSLERLGMSQPSPEETRKVGS